MRVFSTLVGIGMAVLAVLFFLEKAPKRLIDFEKINKEENGKLYTKRISRNIGGVLLLLSIILLLAGLSLPFKERYFLWAMIGWAVIVFLDLLIIDKTGRYRKK